MSHDIEQTNTGAAMFYVGETPWHGLGTRLEDRPTSEEAIKAAKLDWEVKQRPLFTADDFGGLKRVVEEVDHVANYRADTGKILGVVARTWKPLQNKDAFSFFDPFVTSGQASYETAGSLRDGRRIWVLAELSGDPLVIAGEDVVKKYLLLSNSHDGSLAVRVGFTPVRVVCQNTLAAAHSSDASKLIRIRHHGGVKNALEKVGEIMNVVTREFEATAAQYRVLQLAGCNDVDLKRYVNEVFAPERVKKTMAQQAEAWIGAEQLGSRVYPKVQELFENGRGTQLPGVKGTLWGAYNAITEYIAHERGEQAIDRLDSAWFGQGMTQNVRALKVGMEMAAKAPAAA